MTERTFDPAALTRAAGDSISVRRAFGEAYVRDDAVVIPVARVSGATGSGGGGDASGVRGDGGGGGFATHVRPLGVVVVDARGTRWVPTVDVDRAVLGGQLAVAAVATVWLLARALRRRR